MAERSNAGKSSDKQATTKKSPDVQQPAVEIDQIDHIVGSRQAPPSLEELPAQSNAFAARKKAVLQLQRHLGNEHVQRQIAQHQIARQEEETNQTLSTEGMGITLELEGHAASPAVQREDGADAGEAEAAKPAVDVSIKLNPPKVKRMTEKQVQQKHGKPDIAGYTKPEIDISVPTFKTQEIKVVVTLDFKMDLASEYTGGRLQVLRDHEDAHILIAEKVAKEYVVEPLESFLGEMSEFSQGNASDIQTKLGEVVQDFKTEEGTESESFDNVDYPRMKDAYYGVATSLADLASGSAEIKAMVEAMDAFNSGAKAAAKDKDALGDLAKAIVDGQSALGETNMARLQYNSDFKGKVTQAQGLVEELKKKPEDLAEGASGKLDELTPVLASFTWKPDL